METYWLIELIQPKNCEQIYICFIDNLVTLTRDEHQAKRFHTRDSAHRFIEKMKDQSQYIRSFKGQIQPVPRKYQ